MDTEAGTLRERGRTSRAHRGPTPSGTLPALRRTHASPSDMGSTREGERIPGYEILETIGKGNMGRVYRARDGAGRDVALKVILAEVADQENLARFEREGQALAAISPHPNVVTVHSTGRQGKSPYLVLDFVEGEALDQVFKRGYLPLLQAVSVSEQLARAVAHIHDAGVLHRDIKPANVLLRREDGRPVLTDFGMASLRGADRLTRTGDVLGTPLYMSPEQIRGDRKEVDGRADVWALGCVLFEALCGRPPFHGKSLVDVATAIIHEAPPSVVNLCPGADRALQTIVERALTKNKALRYATPRELADELQGWLRGRAGDQPAPAGGPGRLVRVLTLLAVGAVLAAGAAIFAGRQRDQPEAVEDASAGPVDGAPVEDGGAGESPPEDSAEDRAQVERLEAVMAALGKNDLPEGVRLLEPSLAALGRQDEPLRGGLRTLALNLRRSLALIGRERLKDLAASEERLDVIPLEDLHTVLRLVGSLGERLEPVAGPWLSPDEEMAEGPSLAEEVILLVRVLYNPSQPLGQGEDAPDHALELLEALGRSGLRPADPSQASSVIDEVSVSRLSLGDEYYWRVLRAMTRLDVTFIHTHAVNLSSPPPWGETDDPLERYVGLRVDNFRPNGALRVPRGVVRRRLWTLLTTSDQIPQLGPRCRVAGLLQTIEGIDAEESLAHLEAAAELCPDDPWLQVAVAGVLYSVRRYEDALPLADRALYLIHKQGHYGRGALRIEMGELYRDVLRVFVGAQERGKAVALIEDYEGYVGTSNGDREGLRREFKSLCAQHGMDPDLGEDTGEEAEPGEPEDLDEGPR
jgi:Protein kinase domain